MRKQEKAAIDKIIDSARTPSVPGPSYDENFRRTSDGDDVNLLDSKDYKKGWARCHATFTDLLTFLKTATPADLKKFGVK